jgi:hypothetical protein
MQPEFWHKQEAGKPLFPQLEWSRPENRQQAGKLLIVGGNLHGFAAPAEAYTESIRAGIGMGRVLLPSAIQKVVGPSIENGEFAASTPSGSFSQRALVELLDWCKWSDGVLFAGDLGRNSETAIMVEKFLQTCEGPTVITKDTIDYIVSLPLPALERPNTTLVPSFSQLQRLGTAARFEKPLTFSMDLMRIIDWLHVFTERFAPHIIVKHLDRIFVAVNGEVSTTKLAADLPIWRLKTATYAAVWWIQNSGKPFEALTTAALQSTSTTKI